jgi:hypothetical protein
MITHDAPADAASEFIKDFGISFLRRVAGCGMRSPAAGSSGRERGEGLGGIPFEKNLGRRIRERKTNRRVTSVYHGLIGTKRERLKPKGFLRCGMVHGFDENRTRIPLKVLAIPAGFEPATHGVEICYSTECGVGQIASWMFHNIR